MEMLGVFVGHASVFIENRVVIETLEEKVRERTMELEKSNEELKKFNKLFVGRELRMIELKEQIAELEKKLGKKENSK